MRKAILLTAAAAFLAVPAVVQAQDGATSADVTVTATIDGFAEFTEIYDLELDFQTLAADAEEGDRRINTNDGGALELGVRYNNEFAFNFGSGLSTLTRTDGSETIDFTLLCEWVSSEATVGGVSDCDPGTIAQPQVGVGGGSLFVGGILGDLSNVPSGTYTGELEINIDIVDS
jgi:hypothetical protein